MIDGCTNMNPLNQMSDVAQLCGADYPNVVTVAVDQQYWQDQTPDQLIWGYFCLEIIRQFEQTLLDEVQPMVHGPIHSSIGQEAVAVGAAMALETNDKITSTHRAHHHFLAKAIAHYAPPCQTIWSYGESDVLRNCIRRTLAEIMGLNQGWVGGRGGSMHLFDDESGNIGTQAIVAGNIPYTSGIAFAEKFRGTGNVALAYLGDGAISIGPFHEGICLAKVYDLPAIFVIENNLYGVATPARQATGMDDLVIRAGGYNIPGLIVDGMNPLSMKRAVQLAKQHAVDCGGPVLIEAKTYRYYHQAGGMPGSAFGYRSKEEEAQWADRDPLATAPRALVRRGLLDEDGVAAVKDMAKQLIQDAVDYCSEADAEGTRSVRPELIPQPEDAMVHLHSDGHEFAGVNYRAISDDTPTRDIKLNQAKSAVIARWMELEPETFVVGEDVANMKGGAYGATRDALARYDERVLNAPIAEGGIVGLGQGAAVMGMRPIVEIMFCDFALVAADELFNQCATCRYMYNGRVDVPLVVRSRCSAGRGYGAQHSGDTAGLFALYPGWRIVAPATPFDYIGLFNSAMRSLDPVMVLEHHEIDPLEGPVPEGDLDYLIQMGQARIRRTGSDLTVITYLSLVPRVLRIVEELASNEGLDIEVIDLRTLDYAHIDFETLTTSLEKTGQGIIVEQAMATQCLGSYVATRLHQNCHATLRQPIRQLSSAAVPMPVSKAQETAVMISDDTIRNGLIQTISGQLNPVLQ